MRAPYGWAATVQFLTSTFTATLTKYNSLTRETLWDSRAIIVVILHRARLTRMTSHGCTSQGHLHKVNFQVGNMVLSGNLEGTLYELISSAHWRKLLSVNFEWFLLLGNYAEGGLRKRGFQNRRALFLLFELPPSSSSLGPYVLEYPLPQASPYT
jgi:hypothetical protein